MCLHQLELVYVGIIAPQTSERHSNMFFVVSVVPEPDQAGREGVDGWERDTGAMRKGGLGVPGRKEKLWTGGEKRLGTGEERPGTKGEERPVMKDASQRAACRGTS